MDKTKPPDTPTDRIVCDQCRQRRVRCDGGSPCTRCKMNQLRCKRYYTPKRRGRKSGWGKVISTLRASNQPTQGEDLGEVTDDGCETAPRLVTTTCDADDSWQGEVFSTIDQCYKQDEMPDTIAPITLPDPLGQLITKCVKIYLHDVYPIWPVLVPSRVLQMLDRPREPNENSMIFALCSLVITHICGKSEYLDPLFSEAEWISIARRLLSGSLRARENYSFIGDESPFTLLTSFFVSLVHFELCETSASWFYLREAISFAYGHGLHRETFYQGLNRVDALYWRRIYCVLFASERYDTWSHINIVC